MRFTILARNVSTILNKNIWAYGIARIDDRGWPISLFIKDDVLTD